MKTGFFGILAVVFIVAVVSVVTFNPGAAGGVVLTGPVCCTVTPYSQASYGFAQAEAITRTVYCDGFMNPMLCCFNRMSSEFGVPVKVNGAAIGDCGYQKPEMLLPYAFPVEAYVN